MRWWVGGQGSVRGKYRYAIERPRYTDLIVEQALFRLPRAGEGDWCDSTIRFKSDPATSILRPVAGTTVP